MAGDERQEGPSGGDTVVPGTRLIVGLRVVLLIAAASAVIVAVAIATRGPAGGATIRYACPMHAEVRSPERGECPICRMALEPVGFVPGAARPYVEAAGTVDLRALDNVKKHNIIDFVRRRALLPVLQELRAPAWLDGDGSVVAIFYLDQIQAMAPDEGASFSPTDAPGETIAARRTAEAPTPWDRSTALIRFRAAKPSPMAESRAGWLEVAPRARQVVGVAASAVLQSPDGPYVLAWSGHDYTFVKRPIAIGETFLRQGFAAVLDGLEPNDRVIARATFFVDADRRLGADAAQIALELP